MTSSDKGLLGCLVGLGVVGTTTLSSPLALIILPFLRKTVAEAKGLHLDSLGSFALWLFYLPCAFSQHPLAVVPHV